VERALERCFFGRAALVCFSASRLLPPQRCCFVLVNYINFGRVTPKFYSALGLIIQAYPIR